jgi:hypothetical protein
MRRPSRFATLMALLALLIVPGTAAANDRPWWSDTFGDGPCTLEAILVTDLAVRDGGLTVPDLIVEWAVREGHKLTPDGLWGPDGSIVAIPSDAVLGSCPVEVVPGLAVRVTGAIRGGGGVEPNPGGGAVTSPVFPGPVESAEQAWALVVTFDRRFAPIMPFDPEMIGASAWYEIAATKDLPTSLYFVTVTVGWGDCESGCIDRHVWRFTVTRDAVVTLVEEEGPQPPAEVFPGAGGGELPGGPAPDCVPPKGGMDEPAGPNDCPSFGGTGAGTIGSGGDPAVIDGPAPGSPLESSQVPAMAGPWGVLVATVGAGLGVLALAALVARRLSRRQSSPEA